MSSTKPHDFSHLEARIDRLEAGQAEIKSLLLQLTQTESQPTSQGDGAVWPGTFRLNGQEYSSFTPIQWDLLDFLYGKTHEEFEKVMDHIYGHGHTKSDSALESLVRRVNAELADKGCPAEIVTIHTAHLRFEEM